MHRPADRALLTGGALATLLALGGCGNPFAAEDAGQGSEAAEDEAPTFAELQEQMWDAMLSADSVTIEGEVEAGEAQLDDLFEGIEEDERGEVAITGALDGAHSQMSYTAGDAGGFGQRAVDGSEYFYGENFAELFHTGLDDELAEAVDQEFLADLIGDHWVEVTGEGGAVFSAEEFLRSWQRELDGEDTSGITGQRDSRGSAPVWVYSDESDETEYVVSAEGEPHLVELRDQQSHYTFSEWDSSELPDQPDDVITVEEITAAIAEDQGWPTDAVDEEDLPSSAEDTDDRGH